MKSSVRNMDNSVVILCTCITQSGNIHGALSLQHWMTVNLPNYLKESSMYRGLGTCGIRKYSAVVHVQSVADRSVIWSISAVNRSSIYPLYTQNINFPNLGNASLAHRRMNVERWSWTKKNGTPTAVVLLVRTLRVHAVVLGCWRACCRLEFKWIWVGVEKSCGRGWRPTFCMRMVLQRISGSRSWFKWVVLLCPNVTVRANVFRIGRRLINGQKWS